MQLIKKTYYDTLLITICSLLIVLPQVNIDDYAQFTIISKFIFLAYGCLVMMVIFVTMFLFGKPKNMKVSILDIVLLLLIIYVTINRYIIQSNFGSSIRYMELLLLCEIYVIVRFIPGKRYIWLLLSVVVSGITQAAYGLLQLAGYTPSLHSAFKMTGGFFNPGPYAGFLSVCLIIALGLYKMKESLLRSPESKKGKVLKKLAEYVLLLGIMTMALVVPALRSRASWVALAVGIIFLYLQKGNLPYIKAKTFFQRMSKEKKLLFYSATALLVSGLFIGGYYFKKESADGRWLIWKTSSQIIKEHPFFGVGFDRFKAYYMDAQADYFKNTSNTNEVMVADNTYYAFNEFIQYAVENGIVGLFLVIILITCVSQKKQAKKIVV